MSVNCIPLLTHCSMAKLGYAGVNLFFLVLLQNKECGYSFEAVLSMCTHNLCLEQK